MFTLAFTDMDWTWRYSNKFSIPTSLLIFINKGNMLVIHINIVKNNTWEYSHNFEEPVSALPMKEVLLARVKVQYCITV